MEFRAATEGDAERIAILHAESWRRTYRGMMADSFLDGPALSNRLAVWHERLHEHRPDQFTYLALDADRLVGFICVFGGEDAHWGSYVDNLHVDAGYRRRGAGSALMSGAARWLLNGYADRGVYLWVMEANASARRFYERLGARNHGTILKVDPGGGSAPNCRYTWERPESLCDESRRTRPARYSL